MAQKFRFDGWVKSATGAAVPGAQIYLCTQPANTSVAPPTPLATVYSDVNGLIPLSQPLITDGFGHYNLYVAAGRYTIVVALGEVIQQVYVDQVPMGSSVPGTDATPILQTDGSNNTLQSILNLKSGTGISLTADASGGVLIAGNAALTLKINNTLNASQTVLNLTDTTTVKFTDNGAGAVSASFGSFGTSGLGYFSGPGITLPAIGLAVTNRNIVPVVANAVVCTQFMLLDSITIRKITWNVSANVGGSSVAFGIYSADGNTKVIDSGAISSATTGIKAVTLGAAVTLSALTVYWFVQTCTAASGVAGPSVDAAISLDGVYAMFSNSTVRYGRAANNSVAGALPSALGVITAITTVGNACGFAIPLFEA